jgi:phage shock protein A
MALLERVTTLLKANVNDLISKAEQPEKMLDQLLLDMENQFMQVKTQVAIAIADQHLLEKRKKENLASQQEWVRKAELAIGKSDEVLARAALDKSLTYETAAHNFGDQIEDQSHQVEMLKSAMHKLEQKMSETRAGAELLVARHRRARLAARAGVSTLQHLEHDGRLRRVGDRVVAGESGALGELPALEEESAEKRLAKLERDDRVDRLLADLKRKAE